MQSQVLGGAIGGHPCDGTPWLAPKTSQGILRSAQASNMLNRRPAQGLLVPEVSRDASSATMLISLGSTTE